MNEKCDENESGPYQIKRTSRETLQQISRNILHQSGIRSAQWASAVMMYLVAMLDETPSLTATSA
ncbi:hypothetical protein V1291_005153 [Nitrobacteraceae bacterium AZCC 1564]